LHVWQKAHVLTLAIYKATQCFPKEERFGLTSQIRRSSASVGANLAEGCGRRSDGEMARFVHIAMGSGAELSYHLRLARDLDFLSNALSEQLRSDLNGVMRMLSSLSQKLKPRSEVVQLRAKG
jgi:four helix bundle protein